MSSHPSLEQWVLPRADGAFDVVMQPAQAPSLDVDGDVHHAAARLEHPQLPLPLVVAVPDGVELTSLSGEVWLHVGVVIAGGQGAAEDRPVVQPDESTLAAALKLSDLVVVGVALAQAAELQVAQVRPDGSTLHLKLATTDPAVPQLLAWRAGFETALVARGLVLDDAVVEIVDGDATQVAALDGGLWTALR
mgnify:CR=1 FL=1